MAHDQRIEAFSPEEVSVRAGDGWYRLPWIAGAMGLAGLAGSAWMAQGAPRQFYFSWLVSFLYFLSVALGGLFFVLSLFAARAGWAVGVRRLAENTMATLPVFALLFVPVLFGMNDLFHWAHEEAAAHDPLLAAKSPYLNVSFFVVRAVVYFVLWSALALWYSTQSARQDLTGDHAITRRLQFTSGPGLVVFALTTSFAAVDWMMSLEPHWYSTIFGVYYFSGCVVGVFAFMVVTTAVMKRAGYLRNVVTAEHFHDLGKLLFAFVVFWSYIAFSQFFLIWYGNIPEETVWFLQRMEGSWRTVSLVLAVGHFGIPFLFLMPRSIKRRVPLLVAGAVWMLVMHYLDVYWVVMPTLHPDGARFTLLDGATLLGVGGTFVAVLGWTSRRRALVPLKDPRLPESVSFQNT